MRPAQLLAATLAAAAAATPASATHWRIDRAKSRLDFTVQWNGEPLTAVFKRWTADIDFDPDDLAHSHAAIAIDLASETSDSPENDDGIQGAQGFQVSQFPTARFETTGFSHRGGSVYTADGKLTIKGVTKPVKLTFRLLASGDTARVTGGAELSRLDFGLGLGEWASEKVVAHKVIVHMDLQARKSR